MVGAGFTDELLRSPVNRVCLPEMALDLDAEASEPTLDWPNGGCPSLCPCAMARIGRRSALGLFPCSGPQCNEGAARRADAASDLVSGLSDLARLLRGVAAAGDQ